MPRSDRSDNPDTRRPIRVLHLIHTLERGGTEQLLASWLTCPEAAEFSYAVCCLFGGGPHEHAIRQAGVPVDIAGMRLPYDLAGLYRAARIIARFQPDIVHTHLRCSDLVGPLLARLAGCRRVLTTIHNPAVHYFKPGQAIGRFEAWTYTLGSKLFPRYYAAISQAVAQDIARYMGNKASIWVVHNAIDWRGVQAAVRRSRLQVRSQLGLSERTPLFLCVARLEYQKGHNDLLKAFAEVRRRCPEAVLLLAGEGTARDQLQRQAADLGLDHSVSFLGRRADVPELLNACDIVVSAAVYEGFGICLAEAMALGAPVIATRVGGIPELVEDGVTGLLIEPGDYRALAQQILDLYDDLPLRRRLAQAGRRRVIEQFDVSRMLERYHDIYRRMLRY